MTRSRVAPLGLATVAFLIGAVPAVARTGIENATVVRVGMGKAGEFSYVLSAKEVRRGTVIFQVTNYGTLPHEFRIAGKHTPSLKPGQSTTLPVTFRKPGIYLYLCTAPGHAASGMKGTLKVT
jgi:uncharacterized cupredoxin-like copper-binding protein